VKKKVSFLVSGRGSNFTAVAERIINGQIKADLGVVISNNKKALALETAQKMGIVFRAIDHHDYLKREDHEQEVLKVLKEYKTDLVVAAGYLRVLSADFIKNYQNRIINIHPALLPSFPGLNAQKQAFDYGVKVTGCTSHFIDSGVDTGPIILQETVKVESKDTPETLSQKILAKEHLILSESVKLFCENRLKVEGRKIFLLKN
jgi:phosphoribosylglycinamide formyltransferase-1